MLRWSRNRVVQDVDDLMKTSRDTKIKLTQECLIEIQNVT